MRTDARNLGVLTALLMALAQFIWVILVATGTAQPLVDFVMRAWFFEPTLKIMPFGLLHACALVAFGAGVGYVIGWSMSIVLNASQRFSA